MTAMILLLAIVFAWFASILAVVWLISVWRRR